MNMKYNVVQLAFDESSMAKADPPKFIGNSKYGSGFENSVIPRSICTEQ